MLRKAASCCLRVLAEVEQKKEELRSRATEARTISNNGRVYVYQCHILCRLATMRIRTLYMHLSDQIMSPYHMHIFFTEPTGRLREAAHPHLQAGILTNLLP